MSSLLRVQASPALLPRALVSLGALFAIGWAALGYASGAARAGPGFAMELLALAVVGALTRRYGSPLPGNDLSPYVLGVVASDLLARGWAFATVVAPLAVLPGDLWLRRLPPRAAFGNAAHLAAGTAAVGLLYARLGGAIGAGATGAPTLPALAAVLLVLPIVINGTFYLELALGSARAWVDPRLTARWEGTVYACAALLALGWLRLVHADLGAGTALPLGLALTTATVGRLSVMGRAASRGRGCSQVGSSPAPKSSSRCTTPVNWSACGACDTRTPRSTATRTATCSPCSLPSSRSCSP